jgi:hypothetical protein
MSLEELNKLLKTREELFSFISKKASVGHDTSENKVEEDL